MSRRDGTGPTGDGPGTGRGLGRCGRRHDQEDAPFAGARFGSGGGRGRRWRHGSCVERVATGSPNAPASSGNPEQGLLHEQIQQLEQAVRALQTTVGALESANPDAPSPERK